jgi:hypothetical protein
MENSSAKISFIQKTLKLGINYFFIYFPVLFGKEPIFETQYCQFYDTLKKIFS